MPRTRGAGDLTERVALDRRIEVNPDLPDDFGNTVSDWQEQFETSAGFIHLRGGESVMAGRLQGNSTLVIFVRASSQTRMITTEWRLRDVRTGIAYNISEASPTTDRKWIDILAQSGVASG